MSIEDHTAIPSGQTPLNAFMHSGRGRSGKPDTSFFWLLIEGKQCIAKVLTTEQGPHLSDFVKNEQQVLRLLQEKGAPVCKLVEYPSHPEWLVTEFGGLSLALLGGRGSADWPSLPIQEYVSIWAHFLYRARNLANLGAVPLDLAGRNLVVPMGANGQLKLNEAVSIDHAHTVLPSAQLALKRPMWIDSRRNPHLAPELKDALQKDQEKLIHLLAARDAFLPDSTAGLAQGPNGLSARTWLEYVGAAGDPKLGEPRGGGRRQGDPVRGGPRHSPPPRCEQLLDTRAGPCGAALVRQRPRQALQKTGGRCRRAESRAQRAAGDGQCIRLSTEVAAGSGAQFPTGRISATHRP